MFRRVCTNALVGVASDKTYVAIKVGNTTTNKTPRRFKNIQTNTLAGQGLRCYRKRLIRSRKVLPW